VNRRDFVKAATFGAPIRMPAATTGMYVSLKGSLTGGRWAGRSSPAWPPARDCGVKDRLSAISETLLRARLRLDPWIQDGTTARIHLAEELEFLKECGPNVGLLLDGGTGTTRARPRLTSSRQEYK
jgi:hypothetical protein